MRAVEAERQWPEASGHPPAVTKALCPKGRDTRLLERDLCRAPIWHITPPKGEDELTVPLVLYGRPLRQLSGRALMVADQRVFADVVTRWVRDGCPADRRVPYSLADATRALGRTAAGGRDRQLARAALVRLRGATYESVLRQADGAEAIWVWGLVDEARFLGPGQRHGHVVLSQVIADLMAGGAVTYLHAPTWDAIAYQDTIAGRLWTYLEAETLREPRRYPLFGGGASPALADLLDLRWARRWRVAQRVGAAAGVIEQVDPRYTLALTQGRDQGSWHLVAGRSGRACSAADSGPLPTEVMRAWRRAHEGRLPAPGQVGVVAELLTRWQPDEVAAMLLAGVGGDPLARVMAADRSRSEERLALAECAERQREADRELEAAGANDYVAHLRAAGVTLPRWATARPPVPQSPVSETGLGGTQDGALRDWETGLCGTGARSKSGGTVVSTVVPTVGDSLCEAPSGSDQEVGA